MSKNLKDIISKLNPGRRKKITVRAGQIISEEQSRRSNINNKALSTNTWNYRVLRHPDGSLSLHEVYYEDGRPLRYTADPVYFAVDQEEGLMGLTANLERALSDVKQRPILDTTQFQHVGLTAYDRTR